jgi:hypothetical protein
MPGYKALPSFMKGETADQVREAEVRQRVGDSEAAVRLLEDALEASTAATSELPGWLCGRLAALYRTLGRYDDEVLLLERYRDSQRSEDARTRYDARLSKARTIAERKRRSESGALASVRASLGRPRPRRGTPPRGTPAVPQYTEATVADLCAALADRSELGEHRLRGALSMLAAEAAAQQAPVESLVAVLRTACDDPRVGGEAAEQRAARYGAALIQLLAVYFREEES